MASIRWGVVTAVAALIISVILGLIAGVQPFYIFLRGIVFTVLFFGIGFAIRFMINNFFPELMYMDDGSSATENYEQTGTQVNITLDSTGEYAVPELYKTPGDAGELGNIEDLISGNFHAGPGIDSKPEDGYNKEAGSSDSFDLKESPLDESIPEIKPAFSPGVSQGFTPSFGDDSEGLGGLPDLDAMMNAFSSMGNTSGTAPAGFTAAGVDEFIPMTPPVSAGVFEPDRSKYKGNKPETLEGDFNPKELAAGIRTVLNKDT